MSNGVKNAVIDHAVSIKRPFTPITAEILHLIDGELRLIVCVNGAIAVLEDAGESIEDAMSVT